MTPTTPAEGYTLRDAEREMPYPMWPMSIRIRDFMRSLAAEAQSLRERVETAEKALWLACVAIEDAGKAQFTQRRVVTEEIITNRPHPVSLCPDPECGTLDCNANFKACWRLRFLDEAKAALKTTQTEEG